MGNLKFILIIVFLFSFVSTNPTYCDICKESLNNKFLVDAWGNKFHESHVEDGHFCNTCSRIISKRLTSGGMKFNDGRYMCKLCASSMIDTERLKLKSIENVIKALKNVGIEINFDDFKVNLVDMNSLKKLTVNLSKHYNYSIKAVAVLNSNGYVINVLGGLNQLEFESALAHEILHIWVDYNNIKLHRDKLEGFCNLGSYLIYKNSNTQLAQVLKRSIDENEDPDYGQGYKYMNSLLAKHGWDKLISMLHGNNQN